jgi:hypothetical protein
MRKHILIGGDSFSRAAWKKYGWDSDDDTLSDNVWGKMVGDELNMGVKFVSSVTSCNSRIASLVCTELRKNPTKYSLVCILWSNFFPYQLYNVPYVRWDSSFMRTSPNFYAGDDIDQNQKLINLKDIVSFSEEMNWSGHTGIEEAIVLDNIENNIKKTEIVCNYHGAKLISMQGTEPFNSVLMNTLLPHFIGSVSDIDAVINTWKTYLNSDIIQESMMSRINMFSDANFIGWPLIPDLGGYSFESVCTTKKGAGFYLSKKDLHPSLSGHTYIYNKFINHI